MTPFTGGYPKGSGIGQETNVQPLDSSSLFWPVLASLGPSAPWPVSASGTLRCEFYSTMRESILSLSPSAKWSVGQLCRPMPPVQIHKRFLFNRLAWLSVGGAK